MSYLFRTRTKPLIFFARINISGQNSWAKSYFGDTHIITGQKTLPHGQSTWLTVPQEVGSYRVFTNQCKVSVPSTFTLVYESGFLTFKAASPFYRRWNISTELFKFCPTGPNIQLAGAQPVFWGFKDFWQDAVPGNHSSYLVPFFSGNLPVKFHTTFIGVDATQHGGCHSPPGDTYGSACSWGAKRGCENWRHGVEFWRT